MSQLTPEMMKPANSRNIELPHSASTMLNRSSFFSRIICMACYMMMPIYFEYVSFNFCLYAISLFLCSEEIVMIANNQLTK